MKASRREFVATGLAAGVYASQAPVLGLAATAAQSPALASEDGYKLWLRFAPPSDAVRRQYFRQFGSVVVQGDSPTSRIIRDEMTAAIASIVGSPLTREGPRPGDVAVGTPTNSELIRGLGWAADLDKAGPEGFVIRTTLIGKRNGIAIASAGEIGALYGAYHFLRLLQTGQSTGRLDITERPKVQLRMINHWDNMDGSIERGYAGRSLWQWNELAGHDQPALRRLRARERLDRHQWHGHQQRQRQRARPDARLPGQSGRARRSLAACTASACTCRRTSRLRYVSVV